MAENKTKATDANVAAFLDAVEPEQRRADGRTVCALMERILGELPALWGPSIIGFGRYITAMKAGVRATWRGSAFRRARLAWCCIFPKASRGIKH